MPLRARPIVAGWRRNAERNPVRPARDGGKFGLPAHIDQIAGTDGVMKKLLDILLLKIVHRQIFFARWMRHLEPEDLLAAVVTAAEAPAQRLLDEGRDRPDPFQNMHARPRDADGPAAIVEKLTPPVLLAGSFAALLFQMPPLVLNQTF